MALRPIIATLGLAVTTAGAAGSWNYTPVASFGKPGANPLAALVLHPDGAFYGTTSAGGAHDAGALFRLGPDSVETLHHFSLTDGAGPTEALVAAADGTLYGTTSAGGDTGFGTVFRFNPADGILTPLVHFTGTGGLAPGSVPGGLVLHPDGFLYGVTRAGGSHGQGTAFRLAPGGALTTLHHFDGPSGADPCGPLAIDGGGLFGLCRSGGAAGLGSAFRLTPAGTFTPLFSFTGNAGAHPGAHPAAGLLRHSSGLLVGTTEFGGSSGFGTTFSLGTTVPSPFATLHHFADPTGSQPRGPLVEGADTHLYGTAANGGASGLGNLFQLTLAGVHTPLHDFTGPDGAAPLGGLAADAAGLLHGITSAGGPGELGRAFTLATDGTFTAGTPLSPTLGHTPSGAPVSDGSGGWLVPLARGGSLGSGTIVRYLPATGELTPRPLGAGTGDTPDGALTAHNGGFYGICARGGAVSRGTAFRYDPATGCTPLADFNTSQGSLAEGPLVRGSDGALYGLAREGGSSARGTLYKITTAGVRTRILSFTGTGGLAPGRDPRGPLVPAPNLSFYGTTALGGPSNTGVLFKVDPLGTYRLLAGFGTSGPRLPDGGLVLAADGLIYGTCSRGGDRDGGAILRIDPAQDTWSVVASFDPTTAAEPAGELLATPDGAVSGFTTAGHGAVFRYHPASGLEILATLTGNDPATPGVARAADESNLAHTGGLALLPDGSLLGTTPGGGTGGGGSLFLLAPPPPASPLAVWKLEHLGDTDAPDEGDPDHDQLATLVEYALDSDPAVRGTGPDVNVRAGALEMRLPRQPAHSDVTTYVEASSDPAGPWQTLAQSQGGQPFAGPGYVSGDAATPGLKAVLVRDTLAPPSAPRRFLRLRVVR